MKVFVEAKNLTMYSAIKEYGKNISKEELKIIREKLKPYPKGTKLDKEEAKYRDNMIKIVNY